MSCETRREDSLDMKDSINNVGQKAMEIKMAEKETEKPESLFKSILHYPKAVFFILANEFAERFSFYGMKAVLILYLTTVLMHRRPEAMLIYHSFVALAFLAPIFGSILADGFLGRYKVIVYVSIVYVLGQTLLSVSSITSALQSASGPLCYVSLFVIALATGGIKPNVSSFAADQFPAHMQRERSQFFSLFYFSINLGSFLSFIVTPYLRVQVSCDGRQMCFPLAFGVPAICMLIAFIIFISGRPFYRLSAAEGTVLLQVGQCVIHAIKERFRKCSKEPKPKHWLDYASPAFSDTLISNVKSIFRLTVLFLPGVVWSCINDQTGSAWVSQARKMDGQVGSITILPDQLVAINPILIVVLVPLLEGFLYPFIMRHGIANKSLTRMKWGLVLCTIAPVVSGVIQIFIEKSLAVPPPNGEKELTIYNGGNCPVELMTGETSYGIIGLESRYKKLYNVCNQTLEWRLVDCPKASSQRYRISQNDCSPEVGTFMMIWNSEKPKFSTLEYETNQMESGFSRLQLLFEGAKSSDENYDLKLKHDGVTSSSIRMSDIDPNKPIDVKLDVVGSNIVDAFAEACDDTVCRTPRKVATVSLHMGSTKIIAISSDFTSDIVTAIEGYSLSILWQIPQYIIITISEILFNVSGLEFAYSEADPSLKSVMTAIWLMTTFLGNILVIIISGGNLFNSLITETFVYSGLMALSTLAFFFLAKRYKSTKSDHS